LVVEPPVSKTPAESVRKPNEPATASDFLARGIARQAAHDLSGAEADFTRVLELDPKLGPRALVRRAAAHWSQADLHSALIDCEEALAKQPDYAYAWLVRAQIKVEAGDPQGALKDLEQGTAKLAGGAEPGAYHLRASILAELGRTADALAAYRQAVRLEQTPAELDRAHWGLWVARSRSGETVEACDDLKKYLDTRRGDDWFKVCAGLASGEVAEPKLLEEARRRGAADLVQAHYAAGLKRLFTGDKAGARDQFQAGAALGRKHALPVANLEAELARLKKSGSEN
jgi:tetratricopeptide (TPR) repeat protein